jgi:hypothetical protein
MKLFIPLLLLLLSVRAVFAAEPPRYNRYSLKLPGQLMDIASVDLDGDGLGDIAAFCQSDDKRRPHRTVSVFYQRLGSGFPSNPDQTWPLDPDAVAFDVGVISRNSRAAICYVRPDGLFAYTSQGRAFATRPVQLIRTPSVFSQPDPLDLPRWPLLFDGGDGGPALGLIPSIDRLSVYSSDGGAYRPAGSLPLATQTRFTEDILQSPGPLTISHKIPVLVRVGWGSAASRDLMVTCDDNADVWLKKPGGGFVEGPALRFRPGLLDARKDSIESASVQAVDLEGNGRCDIVVTKTAGGVAQAKSLVFIYERRADGSFPAKPTQTIIAEGVLGPKILDMNGDGRQDIVLPTIKMGISNFINMLTSKQINMSVGFYLMDKNGRYSDMPTKEKAVSFKLDISNMGKNARPVMSFGRFTKGPGLGLAVASKEDQVSIYLPDRYSVIGDNPAVKLSVNAPTEMELSDLNGDGIDDLVMSYKKTRELGREVNIFLSR